MVDTDVIAHALTARHGRAIEAIRASMGADLISPDGSLNRGATRQRVFSDRAAKGQLESILHPLIREEVEAALGAPAVMLAPYILLVVPLLFETSTYRASARTTLLVDCAVTTQLERVQRRSGLAIDEAKRIVAAQLPRAVKLQLADQIIWNGEGMAALGAQTDRIHRYYMQQGAAEA